MSRHASSYSSGVAVGSFERVDQSVSTIMSNISKEVIRKRIIRGSHDFNQNPTASESSCNLWWGST